MGHHARGDSRKMVYSSEDDEGYENRSFSTRSDEIPSRSNMRDKRDFVPGIFGEVPSLPRPPLSDDTDRPFWAEDEMSSSESRQRLNGRHKRRRSLSYRNRVAVHRSRSLLFQSSSSSTDSTRLKILTSVGKRGRYRVPGKFELGQLAGRSIAKKKPVYTKVKVTVRPKSSGNLKSESQKSTQDQESSISRSKKYNETHRKNYSTSSSGNGSTRQNNSIF